MSILEQIQLLTEALFHTIIGQGVRIDNLVQIAHNVEIGDNSVLVAQVGIAGSTKLGKFVVAAGQAGIAGHLTIGNGAKIAAQSGLMRNVLIKKPLLVHPQYQFVLGINKRLLYKSY